MYLFDALFFLRVRPSFLPHGDAGCRPPEDLPSPPPSGWSTGFIATPRTVGRLFFQRARPALPSEISSCSGLPTVPTVALAAGGHQARLARGQAHGGHRAFLGHQLHARPGRARELGARSRLQLDRMHDRAHRDVAQRQGVAGTDLGVGAAHQLVALLHALRREDVALLAVGVVQQGDARAAVRVVLDVRDLGRHAVLVPLEVDHAVALLRAAALVARRDAAVHVAPGLAVLLLEQRLLGGRARDLVERRDARAASARGRRLVLTDGHAYPPSKISIASPSARVTMARFSSGRLPFV